MKDLFVSYSRKDKRKVMKIVSLLQSQGYSIWIDESGIETGEQFKRVIVNAIEECKVVLFFSSEHSNKSPWTAKEIGVAYQKNKPILPIKLDETDYNEDLLFDLVNLDYCDLTHSTHRKEQIEGLLKSLKNLIDVNQFNIIDKSSKRNYVKKAYLIIILIIAIIATTLLYLRATRVVDMTIIPQRGAILDEFGRKLAYSKEQYDVYIDKVVISDVEDRLLKELSDQIAEIVHDGTNAYQYYSQLVDHNERYLLIAKDASDNLTDFISNLPLFKDGGYDDALIFQSSGERIYPYGELLSYVLGTYPSDSTNKYGLEYNLNSTLSGNHGKTYFLRKFNLGLDKTERPKPGLNIRTTINLEFQTMIDSLLRCQINNNESIESGFVMILESKSGAIRAMVSHDGSQYDCADMNWGHLFSSEIGGTFQTVSLAILLENKDIRLSDELSTNHGYLYDRRLPVDLYIQDFERKYNRSSISVLQGFTSSSRYTIQKAVLDHYGEHPAKFVNMLHNFSLDEHLELGIEPENKRASIFIPNPNANYWSNTDLATIATGYGIKIPQTNILAFYNTIANNGKRVNPYLIESYENSDQVLKKVKPSISDKALLSIETIDSLKYALSLVNKVGPKSTTIAGTTGTTRIQLNMSEQGGSKNPYSDINGKKKYLATYIGFFPADYPQYTIYTSFQSKLTDEAIYGRGIPAKLTGDIVAEICRWNPSLKGIDK